MQSTVSCDGIGNLNGGGARAMIDAAFRDAVADLDDRGSDEKERVVVITVRMKPREDGNAEVTVEAHAKIPSRRTPSTVAAIRREANGPALLFNPFSPGDPSQRTLDEVGG